MYGENMPAKDSTSGQLLLSYIDTLKDNEKLIDKSVNKELNAKCVSQRALLVAFEEATILCKDRHS